MKKVLKLSLLLAASALVFTSCNCFKKMAKHRDEINLTVNPEILALNNGKVAADITVTFPVKYFNPKAVVKVTPVMVFEGGEVAAAPAYLQGSKVTDNYTVIDKNNGGSYTLHAEFPYDERMAQSALQLRAEVKCGDKEFTLINLNDGSAPTKEQAATLAGTDEAAKTAIAREFGLTVAYGVNTLQKDLAYSDLMKPMANDYKRVTTTVDKTDMRYAINSSVVTKENQKNADLDAFKANVDNNLNNDRATQSIAVKGYASPDGPETLNDKLSAARSNTSLAVVQKLLKDSGLNIDASSYGEDWDGFKELVEKSNIQDKDMILQVLNLYSSASEREKEIKNMSDVFGELKTDVLPELRRSQIVNTTDLQGKTDDEIMAAFNNGETLSSADEYLFAAQNLAKTPEEQLAILTAANKAYPNDARMLNNLGIAQSATGDNAAALKSFEQASKLDNASEITNNLVMSNLANGNTDAAKQYAQAGDAQQNAALAAAQGDYKTAAQNLSGFDAAIAYVMDNNLPAAKNAIAQDTSAKADYLRAVIAAKEGDLTTGKAQLQSAIAKDPTLADRAAKDINLKALQ